MIFIARRGTAIRPMHEARDLGELQGGNHYDRIGALRELRSLTQLPLNPAVELIDRVIAGEKMKIETLSNLDHGNLELIRFVKVMDGLGFIVSDDFVETDDTEVE